MSISISHLFEMKIFIHIGGFYMVFMWFVSSYCKPDRRLILDTDIGECSVDDVADDINALIFMGLHLKPVLSFLTTTTTPALCLFHLIFQMTLVGKNFAELSSRRTAIVATIMLKAQVKKIRQP